MEELERKLQAWEHQGLIGSEQADAIAGYERSRSVSEGPRIPLVAEVLAYAGAALALAAAVQLGAAVWDDLPLAVQLALLTAVSAALWAAGWWVRGSAEPALQRLCTFLWALSAIGVGFLAEMSSSQGLDLEAPLVLTGPALLAYAGALYAVRRSGLQLAAVAAGVALTCGGLSDLGDNRWFGALLWLAGAAWLGLTRRGVLAPRIWGYVLGSAGVLVGAQALVFEHFFEGGMSWALWLGLVSTVALLALSVTWREMALLASGTVGLLVFLPQLIDDIFGGVLAGPVALLVAGVATLGAALASLRLKERVEREAVAG